jgi:hypothetical protein
MNDDHKRGNALRHFAIYVDSATSSMAGYADCFEQLFMLGTFNPHGNKCMPDGDIIFSIL